MWAFWIGDSRTKTSPFRGSVTQYKIYSVYFYLKAANSMDLATAIDQKLI